MSYSKSSYCETPQTENKLPITNILLGNKKRKAISVDSTVEEMSEYLSKKVLDKIFQEIKL